MANALVKGKSNSQNTNFLLFKKRKPKHHHFQKGKKTQHKQPNQNSTKQKKTQQKTPTKFHPLSNTLEKQCFLRAGSSVPHSSKEKKTTCEEQTHLQSHKKQHVSPLWFIKNISLKYFWSLENFWPMKFCLPIFQPGAGPAPVLFSRLHSK